MCLPLVTVFSVRLIFDIDFISSFRYPSEQSSERLSLHQGHLYYMEADMLETEGGDHLEVGVVLPDGKKFMPIPKKLLRTGRSYTVNTYFSFP